MDFLSATEIAELWGISARSVRDYCRQERIPGAFQMGKTWSIPSDAKKPTRKNAKRNEASPLLSRLKSEKAADYPWTKRDSSSKPPLLVQKAAPSELTTSSKPRTISEQLTA